MIPEISVCKAIIFLYPLSQLPDQHATVEAGLGGFYMKQTIENACGSIALIHALANNPVTWKRDSQSYIHKFVAENESLSPEERGERLELDEEIRDLHASFSIQGQTEAPDAQADIDLHFVAFVQDNNGKLYELDGRQAGPIEHGVGSEGPCSFFSACCHAIQSKYLSAASDATFVALALVPKPQ